MHDHRHTIQSAYRRLNSFYIRERFMAKDIALSYIEHEGVGTPVIFLHGWGGNAYVWMPVLQPLVDAGRTHALLDLPGFGESETPAEAWGIADFAEALSELYGRLGTDTAVLVGHSFGGQIATAFAHSHPERVERLVLVDSATVRSRHTTFLSRLAGLVKPIFRIPGLRGIGDAILDGVVGVDYRVNPDMYPTKKRVVKEDLTSILQEIDVPTLVIWGADDRVTPLRNARIVAERMPKAELVIFERAGHHAFLDRPERFRDTLSSFLNL